MRETALFWESVQSLGKGGIVFSDILRIVIRITRIDSKERALSVLTRTADITAVQAQRRVISPHTWPLDNLYAYNNSAPKHKVITLNK